MSAGTQTVVVTGASAGVGRATARAFGARGAAVALLARGKRGLQGAAEEVRAAGGSAVRGRSSPAARVLGGWLDRGNDRREQDCPRLAGPLPRQNGIRGSADLAAPGHGTAPPISGSPPTDRTRRTSGRTATSTTGLRRAALSCGPRRSRREHGRGRSGRRSHGGGCGDGGGTASPRRPRMSPALPSPGGSLSPL